MSNKTEQPQTEAPAEGNVFLELLGELGDHHGLIIGPYHVADLPLIFYDEGFHFYPTVNKMEEAGMFTMHNRHIVKTSDHTPPALDLSITNFVFFQWLVMIILFIFFKKASNAYKRKPNSAPRGIQNMFEVLVTYIRDEIVVPNIPSKNAVYRLLPYFVTLFFFILGLNLIGLIPGGHTATSSLGVTAALAVTAFIVINITSIKEAGLVNYFKHLLGGAPPWLFFIMIPIEILSMFIKPFALTIRLFANMTAGHVVLFALLGLIFYFKTILISPAIVGFSVFIYFLELLVAFIQAYIFTMLTAIFVGLAIGEHGSDAHAEHTTH